MSSLKDALQFSRAYELAQYLFGAGQVLKRYAEEYVKCKENAKVLDIGCGTSSIIEFLPTSASYTGIDISQAYIDKAIKKHSGRNRRWIRFDIGNIENSEIFDSSYDVVMMNGVLHHIDDRNIRYLSKVVPSLLSAHGRFVSIDCAYTDSQSWLGSFLASKDRGKFVRRSEEYTLLLKEGLKSVECSVRYDLSFLPYTYAINTCEF